MSINASSFSAGYTGCKVISGVSPVTGTYRGFVVNSDAVIADCLDEASASLMASIGLTGVTLKPGIYICVPDGKYISSITLTSGSVVAYPI